ncbi:MAG TPA: hypothetical protein VIS48_08385 [Candidatus Kryptonia bacterium]
MIKTEQSSTVESGAEMRIVGLNTDKTRALIGSDSLYQVYFELSGIPTQGWRTVFEREWKALNVGQALSLQDTSVERAFLVMHCPLQDVAKHLPILKKAVAAANKDYSEYARGQAEEEKGREDLWKNERKTVEDVAKSLHFD